MSTHHEADLDALMVRVRDAVARRRDGATEAPRAMSLDGVIRRQTELNDAVARALTALSNKIDALDRTREAPRPAVTAIAAERLTAIEERIAALESSVDDRAPVAYDAEINAAFAATEALQRQLAALTAAAERTAGRQVQAELTANRQRAAIDARLQRIDQIGAALEDLRDSVTAQLGAATDSIAAVRADLAAVEAASAAADARAQAALSAAEQAHAAVADASHVALSANHLAHTTRALGEALRADMDACRAHVEGIDGRAAQALAHLPVLEEKLDARLDEMRMRVLRAERAVRDGGGTAAAESRPAPPAASAPPFDYFMFEHRFRGTGDDIRRRQTTYVDLFQGRQHVVDLGCGRGEFLQVALQHGIGITGVDSNADMVAFCRDLGLPAVRADLLAYLTALPENSVDGLFCAQVVEHLDPDTLQRFVHLAASRIKPGAPLVIETVNPHCPLALGNFYLDPTHARPVPPLMLRFLLEQARFTVNALRFSSAVPGHAGPDRVEGLDPLPADAPAYQDYAAIAVRS
jgi:SAM-dependent methyltransferase